VRDAGGTSDAERFERLYSQTYPAVVGYVLRRCTDPADAADVVAETYLTLWRRLGELPQHADTRLWLYGVARRVLANRRRSADRSAALQVRLTDDFATIAEDSLIEDSAVDRDRISAAFRRLRDDDRELLALVGWEGLDRDQIATTLGVSRAVVRVRLHRARTRFARELATTEIVSVSPTAGSNDAPRRPSNALDQEEALS
jgi:RNA polymerase sigma factor (sigma-70 family)